MTERDDRDLRDRFEALRREDAERGTPFPTTLGDARARRLHPPRRAILPVAAAVVAAAALIFLITRHHRQAAAIDLASVRWHLPTDFLLQLPGDELLRTVPELGRVRYPGAHTPRDSDRRTP
jgi:hypothetical protein